MNDAAVPRLATGEHPLRHAGRAETRLAPHPGPGARTHAAYREDLMPHKYTLEVFRDGQWTAVKSGLTATLVAFATAMAILKTPGELWRAVRDDGEIYCP